MTIRIRIPKPDTDWTVHFAAEEQRIRTEERERLLAEVVAIIDRWVDDSGMEGHGSLPYLREGIRLLK
jgi:hypothetical protein